jgi:3-dehydroquinate synthase
VFRPGPRPRCRIRLGRGALARLVGDLVQERPAHRWVVISDSTVGPLHGAPLAGSLREAGLAVDTLSLPAGEGAKTRATKERLEDELVRLGAGRDVGLVAVGGGVVGDVVGFLASTWQRGVPVVQVPTSLLAMADAAIGGKTAVNVPGGKNLIGTFHQPWGIYIDPAVLESLPESTYVDGFAEMIKAAVIADSRLFGALVRGMAALRRREVEVLEPLLARCVRIKARIVKRDERESGMRAALNFGHTIAHALEAVGDYSGRHGPAVAVGMCVESRLAQGYRGLPPRDTERLETLLVAAGLPVRATLAGTLDELVAAAYRDKKVREGRVHCALPLRIGRMPPDVTVAVEPDDLRRAATAVIDFAPPTL